jgi:hypothetical protein
MYDFFVDEKGLHAVQFEVKPVGQEKRVQVVSSTGKSSNNESLSLTDLSIFVQMSKTTAKFD